MKQKPRWTMEMLTAALAVLCALLTLVLLIQRPSIWPVLLALVVAWGICMAAFRYQLRRWLSRWVRGDNFEKSKTKFSLEQLSQPTALLSGETVLWYNEQFRARLLGGQDMLTSRVQKVLPGLALQQCIAWLALVIPGGEQRTAAAVGVKQFICIRVAHINDLIQRIQQVLWAHCRSTPFQNFPLKHSMNSF